MFLKYYFFPTHIEDMDVSPIQCLFLERKYHVYKVLQKLVNPITIVMFSPPYIPLLGAELQCNVKCQK